uniref:Ycf22 n=2 Tax=Grateloupia TaxID=31454 RepID=A0A6F8UPD3_9FLOR|nr:Ycf22 [Grateloupia filicina]AWD77377.1 Ycf22 [Grateloupia filicina]BCB14925.1 Ycf22 [Grateloupia asiatica]
MRGINIGYVKNIKMNFNSVLVLVHIKSNDILIPKNAIIETSQTGLLNDAVIDILPLETIFIEKIRDIDVFSNVCQESKFLCNLSYIYGERGLNYDDLIRAATRISQRFDDPRFFNLLYIFLQNSFEISEDIANTTALFYHLLRNFLLYFTQ